MIGNDLTNQCELYLDGTANTSGCSWARPTGSPCWAAKDSTQVRSGLRWAGTDESHVLMMGREESAGGGGRSR